MTFSFGPKLCLWFFWSLKLFPFLVSSSARVTLLLDFVVKQAVDQLQGLKWSAWTSLLKQVFWASFRAYPTHVRELFQVDICVVYHFLEDIFWQLSPTPFYVILIQLLLL
jgi:hypothetical protein